MAVLAFRILVFSIFLTLFSINLVYAIPQFSNFSITIDEGDFDLDLIDDNYIIYSNKTENSSQLFDRVIFFIYDFEKEQRRSFGRYSKASVFFKVNDSEVYVVEPTEDAKYENLTLYNYTINFYRKRVSNNDQKKIEEFKLNNFTRQYFDILDGKDDTILFETIDFEFREFDNDTKEFEVLGESFKYYKIERDTFTQVDKLTYNKLKTEQPVYENDNYLVTLDFIKNKETSEIIEYKPTNTICGVSDNFIYYSSKLYHEGAERPISILVKYDYRNDVTQNIIIDGGCNPGERTFYANPYIFDLENDAYNFLLTDDSKIEVLDGKLVFIDKELNYLFLELEDIDTNSLSKEALEDYNSSSEEEEEIVEQIKDLDLNNETPVIGTDPSNYDLGNDSIRVVKTSSAQDLEDSGLGSEFYTEREFNIKNYLTIRNIVMVVILLELLMMIAVAYHFMRPHKEEEDDYYYEEEPIREQRSIRESSEPRRGFNLNLPSINMPRVNLPKISIKKASSEPQLRPLKRQSYKKVIEKTKPRARGAKLDTLKIDSLTKYKEKKSKD